MANRPHELRSAIITAGAFLAASILVLVLTPGALDVLNGAHGPIRLKRPDLTALQGVGYLVQAHFWTAVSALFVGPLQFILPKGGGLHRAIGWLFVSLMAFTAFASLFIRAMVPGEFSSIHIFSVMTLIALPIGVILGRMGRVVPHAATMIGIYIGLVIAGATAVAPGRILWDILVAGS